MSNLEGPGGPPKKKPDDWSHLEQDPAFQEVLVSVLQPLLMDKKFGSEFMHDYEQREFMQRFETEDGNMAIPKYEDEDFAEKVDSAFSKNIELLPEVESFQEKIASFETLETLLEFTKSEGLELSDEEMQHAKALALQEWVYEHKKGTLNS